MFISASRRKYSVYISITMFIGGAIAFPNKHESTSYQMIRFSVNAGIERSEMDLSMCQGIILSGQYILTSEHCARSVSEQMQTSEIKVLNNKNYATGVVTELKKTPDENSAFNKAMILGFTPQFENGVEQLENTDELTGRLSLYPYSVSCFDENNLLRLSPIDLVEPAHRESSTGFFISGSSQYPQGAVVFDQSANLICIISNKDYCASPFLKDLTEQNFPLNARSKRSSKHSSPDCKMNNNFTCSDFTLSQCSSQGGSGSCINEKSGKLCHVGFYPKGDSAPFIVYGAEPITCSDTDGCGVITCYNSDGRASVDCLAHWGWDCEIFYVGAVQPVGCMDYHRVIIPGPFAGMVIGVFVFGIFCPAFAIASGLRTFMLRRSVNK